jgi:thiol-disulfide isomerase/thioredoxin
MSLPTLLALTVLIGCVPHFDVVGEEREEGTGFEVGDLVPPLDLKDQSGTLLSLRAYEGDVIFLDISTMWCIPCRALAEEAAKTQEDYEDRGFLYVTVLQENSLYGPPGMADLKAWADNYGLDTPVLGDGGDILEERVTGPAIQEDSFPALLVIGRDQHVVERIETAQDEFVREGIERHL